MKVLLTYEDRLDNLLLTEWWVLLSYLIPSSFTPARGWSFSSVKFICFPTWESRELVAFPWLSISNKSGIN